MDDIKKSLKNVLKKVSGFRVLKSSKCPNRTRTNNRKKLLVRVPEPKFSNISVRVPKISDRVAGFRFGLLVMDIFEHP